MDQQTMQALLVIVIPALIAIAKTLAPQLPKALLPVLAPMLGAVAEMAIHYSAGTQANPLVGAALGLAGVGVREIADQLKKAATPA